MTQRVEGSSLVRGRIIETFWERLEHVSLSRITVISISEGANCNRVTFYYYFRDMDDLAARAVEQEFVQDDALPRFLVTYLGMEEDKTLTMSEAPFAQRLGLLARRCSREELATALEAVLFALWELVLCDEGESLCGRSRSAVTYLSSGLAALVHGSLKSGEALDDDVLRRELLLGCELVGEAYGVSAKEALSRLRLLGKMRR